MRRRLPPLLVVWAAAFTVAAATPVPTPVHVQPGAAAADGTVAWAPAVQYVTGDVGDTVAIDLALDAGTDVEVRADLAVREVRIDAVDGPRLDEPSDALLLAVDRIVLRPGDRGAFRGVATIPSRPTVVAVEALLERDLDATPLAFVVLAPIGRHAELEAGVDLAGDQARVTVTNGSSFPALVDVAVTSATWVGPSDDIQIGDVLVPADGRRVLEVELSRGLGRRSAAVAVLARSAPPDATARADVAAWPPRTLGVSAGAVLTLLVGLAGVRALRRS